MPVPEVLRTHETWIEKRPNVFGGDACIRDTRYNLWGLVEWRRLGLADAEILRRHPDLTRDDLSTAWNYFAEHPEEIERALWLNRAGMVDYPSGVPVWLLVQGRQLGLSDEEIRDVFDPPLPQPVLDAAWAEYERNHADINRAIQEHAEA
jgi:uncharacterized protein (DUF433 family)